MGESVTGDDLSDYAKIWQHGLAGITAQQVGRAFEILPKDWPPTLLEFRELCLNKSGVPEISQIVHILVMAGTKKGSIADRYQHPLALAIAKSPGVDMYYLKTAKFSEARSHIRPAYERLLRDGWEEWQEDAFSMPKISLPRPKTDIAKARVAISMIREAIA